MRRVFVARGQDFARTEARSNIRAIWHLDELVARNAGAVCRAHLSPANLTVRRMLVLGGGFLVRNFIESAAMGALKSLSHLKNIP